jgi:hypothetical protein
MRFRNVIINIRFVSLEMEPRCLSVEIRIFEEANGNDIVRGYIFENYSRALGGQNLTDFKL